MTQTVDQADAVWAGHADARAKIADMMAGRDAALSHIRELPGHETKTAEAFRKGAYFLPVTSRSAEAFGGLVFAKTPTRKKLEPMDAYLSDVTGSGQDIDRFSEQSFDAILETGAVMVLVDYPSAPAGLSKAEADALGLRPTLKLYDANSILATRLERRGAILGLTQVRVVETVEERNPQDEFAIISVKQIRVLGIDAAGFYRQRVFRQTNGKWEQHGEPVQPLKQDRAMDYIPAFFSNTRDGEPIPSRPPLDDLADINIAHLNNSALMEWGLMWTGNPTPVFRGIQLGEGDEIKLGSSEGILCEAEGGASFMEFTGSGLSELRMALEAKRKDAALMGARLLLENSKAQIAAETARIERAGETSVISGIANALSDCLTKALTCMADWADIQSDGIQYWLNTDLNPAGLSAQQITALLAAWQSGAITLQDLFENLQRGEIVDPAKSFDQHREELEEEGEALGKAKDEQPPTGE